LEIGDVETVILLTENPDEVRVSLRSRDAVDVSDLARGFGGGGHPRAAGLRMAEDIDVLKRKLITACLERLKAKDSK
jgi:phosphoesterase RecJ-like protein